MTIDETTTLQSTIRELSAEILARTSAFAKHQLAESCSTCQTLIDEDILDKLKYLYSGEKVGPMPPVNSFHKSSATSTPSLVIIRRLTSDIRYPSVAE